MASHLLFYCTLTIMLQSYSLASGENADASPGLAASPVASVTPADTSSSTSTHLMSSASSHLSSSSMSVLGDSQTTSSVGMLTAAASINISLPTPNSITTTIQLVPTVAQSKNFQDTVSPSTDIVTPTVAATKGTEISQMISGVASSSKFVLGSRDATTYTSARDATTYTSYFPMHSETSIYNTVSDSITRQAMTDSTQITGTDHTTFTSTSFHSTTTGYISSSVIVPKTTLIASTRDISSTVDAIMETYSRSIPSIQTESKMFTAEMKSIPVSSTSEVTHTSDVAKSMISTSLITDTQTVGPYQATSYPTTIPSHMSTLEIGSISHIYSSPTSDLTSHMTTVDKSTLFTTSKQPLSSSSVTTSVSLTSQVMTLDASQISTSMYVTPSANYASKQLSSSIVTTSASPMYETTLSMTVPNTPSIIEQTQTSLIQGTLTESSSQTTYMTSKVTILTSTVASQETSSVITESPIRTTMVQSPHVMYSSSNFTMSIQPTSSSLSSSSMTSTMDHTMSGESSFTSMRTEPVYVTPSMTSIPWLSSSTHVPPILPDSSMPTTVITSTSLYTVVDTVIQSSSSSSVMVAGTTEVGSSSISPTPTTDMYSTPSISVVKSEHLTSTVAMSSSFVSTPVVPSVSQTVSSSSTHVLSPSDTSSYQSTQLLPSMSLVADVSTSTVYVKMSSESLVTLSQTSTWTVGVPSSSITASSSSVIIAPVSTSSMVDIQPSATIVPGTSSVVSTTTPVSSSPDFLNETTTVESITESPYFDFIYRIKFQGNCSLIIDTPGVVEMFKYKLTKLLSQKLDVDEERVNVDNVTCGSVNVLVGIEEFPTRNVTEILKYYISDGELMVSVPSLGNIQANYTATDLEVVQAPPTTAVPKASVTPPVKRKVELTVVDLIIIIVVCVVAGSLLLFGLGMCCYECNRRKYSKSFDLGTTPRAHVTLEDFTLTKMNRPQPHYTEGGPVISADRMTSNGHRKGADFTLESETMYTSDNAEFTTFRNSPQISNKPKLIITDNGKVDIKMGGSPHLTRKSSKENLVPSADPPDSPGVDNPSFSSDDILDSGTETDPGSRDDLASSDTGLEESTGLKTPVIDATLSSDSGRDDVDGQAEGGSSSSSGRGDSPQSNSLAHDPASLPGSPSEQRSTIVAKVPEPDFDTVPAGAPPPSYEPDFDSVPVDTPPPSYEAEVSQTEINPANASSPSSNSSSSPPPDSPPNQDSPRSSASDLPLPPPPAELEILSPSAGLSGHIEDSTSF